MAADNEHRALTALDGATAGFQLTDDEVLADPVSAFHRVAAGLQAIADGRAPADDGEAELGHALEDTGLDEGVAPPHGFLIEEVSSTGGNEGGGEYVQRVYALKRPGAEPLVYIEQTGSYYSHDGIYWDDELQRVWPRTVQVIEYVRTPA